MTVSPPPTHVLDSFGLSGRAVLLDGGQGETFRVGDAIVKPAGDPEVAIWTAELFSHLEIEGVRVAQPIKSRSGEWLVDGYGAQTLLIGAHQWDRWSAVLVASARFHQALADVQRPPWIDRHDDVYRRADKFAWAEGDIEIADNNARPLLSALVDKRSAVTLESQLVHGDVGGNVLFDNAAPPAVIDFSPYWRPATYADAIVVVDAVSWHGGSAALVGSMLDRRDGFQLLLRAALFRIGVDAQQRDVKPGVFEGHRRFVDVFTQRAAEFDSSMGR